MLNAESNELIQAKQLIYEGKFDEALHLMKNFEEMGVYSLQDLVSWHLLKCRILIQQYAFKELIELAEHIYKESLGLGKSLLSVDALYYLGLGLLGAYNLKKGEEIIKQGEELLETLTHEPPKDYKQRESNIAFLKGLFYNSPVAVRRDPDLALEYFEQSLALREEYGDKHEIIASLLFIGGIFWYYKGELDNAFEYIERALTLAKESNIKFHIANCLLQKGAYYYFKGDLDRTLMLNEQSLVIFKELNNKNLTASNLNNMAEIYRMRGELERALDCSEQSLALAYELEDLLDIGTYHDCLIQILIEMGDVKRAQEYLNQLEQLNNQLKDKNINLAYLYNKALILKESPRISNRGKAEEILKQILEDKDIFWELNERVLLTLCELLIIEFQMSNEVEVLDELKSLFERLLETAEKSKSYWILCETYLLQAKIALISSDLEEARRLLAKGQKIAEKFGLNRLAISISDEHDKLLNELSLWERLKESNAPMGERIELARLNDQVVKMLRKRVVDRPKTEAEQPILFSIMTREGDMVLSSPFTADMTIDETRFGEFLTSCNTFCDQIFSESFDRVKFGRYTILITAVEPYCVYYMFQGHSYSAQQKLTHFCEAFSKDPTIMKILENVVNENKVIAINELPSLEELIYESFLSDPEQFQMPFKAYEGDGPFVFVSYSHTNRLQVYPIIDYLNRTGINIWYDEGIPVSEDWKSSIVDNLERCNSFLVFITPHIIDSEYVRKEISFALKKQKPFFSVYLKDTELPSELEFEIGNIQFMKKYLIPEPEFYNKLNRMLDPVLNK